MFVKFWLENIKPDQQKSLQDLIRRLLMINMG